MRVFKVVFIPLFVFCSVSLTTSIEAQQTQHLSAKTEANDHIKKGEELFAKELFKEAILEYKIAFKIDPLFAKAYLFCGDCYHMLGDYKAAINYYDKTIAVDPKFVEAFSFKGDALLSLTDTLSAINYYKKALEIKPDYPRIAGKLSNLINETTYIPSARANYTKANDLFSKGEYATAIEEYKNSIQKAPGFALSYIGLGNCYLMLRKYRIAIEYFEKSVKLNPYSAKGQRFLARGYEDFCYFEKSYNCYKHSLILEPDNQIAQTSVKYLKDLLENSAKLSKFTQLCQLNIAILETPRNQWTALFRSYGNALDESSIAYFRDLSQKSLKQGVIEISDLYSEAADALESYLHSSIEKRD
jgi:tetratricopeptide (TPR) repeat protein